MVWSQFIDTNLNTLNKFAVVDGKATRTEFWYFVLFNWMISIAIGILDLFLPLQHVNDIISFILFVPSLTVAIRRMHDVDRAGWWLLAPIVNLILLVSPSKISRWQG